MNDESYIRLAIEIAKKGRGKVSPNPLVGCVIVKNEKIIGAGFHEEIGKNHAEINAINSASGSVEGATLYVNLEPCSHYGKTPPCTDKIIESKIKRVVIGTLDVNPLVSGSGVKALKKAGIEVKAGMLEQECINLNKFFFKFITKKIPYVTLKTAQTLDGKIADVNRDSKWVSSIESRRYVHMLRSRYDAVLIGAGTVLKDDPNLTVRLAEGRNPKRIILDSSLNLSSNNRIFKNNSDKNSIILTSLKSIKKKNKINKLTSLGVSIIYVKESKKGLLDIKEALKKLAKLNITSIIVEGGSRVFTSFINKNLFDDLLVFVTPKFLGEGLPVIGNLGITNIKKAVKIKVKNVETVGDDVLIELVK